MDTDKNSAPKSIFTPIFKLQADRALFLASQSPRRQDMLAGLGLEFSILSLEKAEPEPRVKENPVNFVRRAACAKGKTALTVLPRMGKGTFLLLAADTIVHLDNEIMGKPENPLDALRMLQRLSGKAHQVSTCVYLAWNNGHLLKEELLTESTEVKFGSWPDSVLQAYIDSGETWDKAGSYAIQGRGSFLISDISGSWTNVVGLPLERLIKELLASGLIEINP